MLRNFSRVLPKTASRPSATLSKRTLTSLRKPSQPSQAWRLASQSSRAPFSTALPRWANKEGSVDSELSAKVESELQLEADASSSDELPPHLKEFLDENPFQLQDKPGDEEVVLTRTFGNEQIRITFNIADMNLVDQDPDSTYREDNAMYDEETAAAADMQQGGAQTKGTINQGRTPGGNINVAPEDKVAPADREELADDESAQEPEVGFPASVNVTIKKDGIKGVMHLETIARDGVIIIENVHYFPKAELADAKTADQDWMRQGLYTGPPFGNLDEELQVLLERYLEERGVNTALALWVPEYIDFKEQREYVNWLSNIKTFVDA